eukprot:TRINITY_DN7627_c0_g1_i3.p1 TRINITY_DN7627_c0_g1~~TRINITY_DN7627_c0_g1_i3.p1  ORF type:complete len:165 (+),score=44.54 TRINITY_DN7627_c0_g1_i3:199-693(+)
MQSKEANSYALATIGGLLSSSCCLVQLGLNYLSVGCAGFSVLDPLREYFIALSYGGFFFKLFWEKQVMNQRIFNKSNSITLLILLTLTSSPIAVRWVNNGRLPSEYDGILSEVEIEGMNCEACSNNAKNGLLSIDGVTDCSVDLRTKKAKIQSKRELNLCLFRP